MQIYQVFGGLAVCFILLMVVCLSVGHRINENIASLIFKNNWLQLRISLKIRNN